MKIQTNASRKPDPSSPKKGVNSLTITRNTIIEIAGKHIPPQTFTAKKTSFSKTFPSRSYQKTRNLFTQKMNTFNR